MGCSFSLHRRQALVTWTNTGIGQAVAVGLAAFGAIVDCAGRSSSDEIVDMITNAGGTTTSMHEDFTDPTAGRGSVLSGALIF